MLKFKMIGSDPEFFVYDQQNNITVPSFMITDGTKEFPLEYEKGFKILKDNLVLEGNIPPSSTKEEWINNMLKLKKDFNNIIKQVNSNFTLLEGDLEYYSLENINTVDGLSFGCSNYLNAWDYSEYTTPSFKKNFRTCGFHIHVSFDVEEDSLIKDPLIIGAFLTRLFDMFLGIPSDEIYYCGDRRKGYGALGSFRLTDYGIEYRSLGGYFTKDEYLGWIYDQVIKIFNFINNTDLDLINKLVKPTSLKNIQYNYKLLNINLKDQLNNK